jgi:hypothetical protein
MVPPEGLPCLLWLQGLASVRSFHLAQRRQLPADPWMSSRTDCLPPVTLWQWGGQPPIKPASTGTKGFCHLAAAMGMRRQRMTRDRAGAQPKWRILRMAANCGCNVLICMPNRIKRVPLVSVMQWMKRDRAGPSQNDGHLWNGILSMATKQGPIVAPRQRL